MIVAEVIKMRRAHTPHGALLEASAHRNIYGFTSQLYLTSSAQGNRSCLQGEAPIVQVAWAALCVSFSASLAFVVWGRSGL